MAIKLLKFIISVITGSLIGYTICFASARQEVQESQDQAILMGMQDKLFGLINLQESLKKEKESLDSSITGNMFRQAELENIHSPEEEVQISIVEEISRIDENNRQLELKRYDVVKKLEDIGPRIREIIQTIENVMIKKLPVKDIDLEKIVTGHRAKMPWDGKLLDIGLEKVTYKVIDPTAKLFEDGLASVVQLGALGQARSIEEHTNYCGYYTVYNIKCLTQGGQGVQERLLDRAAFAALFSTLLQQIKNLRHHGPYDNLSEDEIEKLLQSQGVSDEQYVFIMQPHVGVACEFTELTKAIAQSGITPAAIKTVAAFKDGRSNNLFIIFNVGGTGAHWVSIYAHRDEGGIINFSVVDSLNLVDWKDDRIINERLVPLYKFIKF